MHEASATEALVKMVSAEAKTRNAARVSRILLVVGETTGYIRESLDFYFAASARAAAEGALLDIRYVKPLIRCPACGLEFERKRFTFDCPVCGEQGVMTSMGGEFYVDSIEIEESA